MSGRRSPIEGHHKSNIASNGNPAYLGGDEKSWEYDSSSQNQEVSVWFGAYAMEGEKKERSRNLWDQKKLSTRGAMEDILTNVQKEKVNLEENTKSQDYIKEEKDPLCVNRE